MQLPLPFSSRRRGRRRSLLWAGFWIYVGSLVFFAFLGDQGLWASYRLWRSCEKLDSQIARLKTESDGLRTDVQKFRRDRRTIEKYAREELQLVGPNEVLYIFRP